MLFVSATCTGCWDHREVEDLGIVLLTALDDAPGGKIRLEVQILVPAALAGGGGGGVGGMGGGRGSGRKPYRNVDVEAETVFDAIRKLSMETPRRLFFAHNQVIVLSEKLAREKGIPPLLDFFDRNPQIRRDTWLVVARGDIKEIMDVPSQLEVTPAQRVMGIINNREFSSQFAITRLGDFIEMVEDTGVEPFTAIIEMIPNTAVSRVALQPGGPGPEPTHDIKLTGTAVFRRDKLVGWLDEREARGLMWVRGEVRGGPVKFNLPGDGGPQNISVDILRAGRGGVRVEPRLVDGQLSMHIKTSVRVNLVEAQSPGLDLNKPETIKRLEELLDEAIKEEIMAAVNRLQGDYRSDAFGFGQAVHRKYPRLWRQVEGEWEDVFAGMPVSVDVKATIRRTGLVNKPMQPRGGEKPQTGT
ncbi:MAG: Ger(x)C family spore germination protein [Thermoanaerobacteraceae bacterium]|nr:Ger(x)C family spore germination protein [Thermoanaerobacteraceae bacterium]